MSCCKDCEDREVFVKSFEEDIPYSEYIDDNGDLIRTFRSDIAEHLLKWHYDEEDREVYAIESNDWKFQFDNKLPQKILIDEPITIPTGLRHRIIKGTTTLRLKIKKLS